MSSQTEEDKVAVEFEDSWNAAEEDTCCWECEEHILAGDKLWEGGDCEHMCFDCWNRPQHDCMNSCYLVDGQCPECVEEADSK